MDKSHRPLARDIRQSAPPTNLPKRYRQIVLAQRGGKLAKLLARSFLPEDMAAAQRNRSGQFAMINSSRILPPTGWRKSLGVSARLNTKRRFEGKSLTG